MASHPTRGAEIATEADGADDVAGFVPVRLARHPHDEGRPVAASHGELTVPPLSPQGARRDAFPLLASLFARHDLEDVPPDDLGQAPAVELFRGAVPDDDAPLEIGDDDDLAHGVERSPLRCRHRERSLQAATLPVPRTGRHRGLEPRVTSLAGESATPTPTLATAATTARPRAVRRARRLIATNPPRRARLR